MSRLSCALYIKTQKVLVLFDVSVEILYFFQKKKVFLLIDVSLGRIFLWFLFMKQQ